MEYKAIRKKLTQERINREIIQGEAYCRWLYIIRRHVAREEAWKRAWKKKDKEEFKIKEKIRKAEKAAKDWPTDEEIEAERYYPTPLSREVFNKRDKIYNHHMAEYDVGCL